MTRSWLDGLVYDRLVRRERTGALALAQRLLGFTQLNELLATIGPDAPSRQLAQLAEALGVRFAFRGLENLRFIGDRPVIVFANHPTGGGNVLGMLTLLAEHFPDHRILGNRHMQFVSHFSDVLIPVDPFQSGAAINLNALLRLRTELGTKYRALGVFPAGISSRWSFARRTITDRRWSDAFLRLAQHHDALLLPVWFSGKNRFRYHLAATCRKELGFLALPAELLRLRGQTIEVAVGEPIDPDLLQFIPKRRARTSFARAGVYELAQQHAAGPAAEAARSAECWRAMRACEASIPVGEELEARTRRGLRRCRDVE